jgi:hypothetical protein
MEESTEKPNKAMIYLMIAVSIFHRVATGMVSVASITIQSPTPLVEWYIVVLLS